MLVRLFTPTGNRRLNEFIGFLWVTPAIFIALSLLSYSPRDASFNVAGPEGSPSNWIGPVGAHLSDLLFQGLGYAAFLLPAGLLLIGNAWFRSRPMESPIAKLMGFALLFVALPSLFVLWHFPDIRDAIPPGGLLGGLLSSGLTVGFNVLGANLVAVALFLAAVYLTTQFSFSSAHAWLAKPIGPAGENAKPGVLYRARARWAAWREERNQQRMRRRVEAIKISGRAPVPPQSLSSRLSGKNAAIEDEEDGVAGEEDGRTGPVLVLHPEITGIAAKKLSREPRIARGAAAYRLPSPDLLNRPQRSEKLEEAEMKACARAIELKLQEFDVQGQVTQINPGPVVTTYEYKPEAGIKYSRITALSDDLCLALSAESILIERIPGKSTVGVEVPNPRRQTIVLRENIESAEFVNSASKLSLAMGKDLIGRIRVSELTQMPHLLIAGSTGTGKSVFINSLLVSMLYKSTPDELKLVLVDPKQVELKPYEEIPHLLAPVVTNPKVASNVLRNATREMEQRLKKLAQRGVRNIEQYNRTFQRTQSLSLFDSADEVEHSPMPYIVIVIDELADLMMVDTNNVEEAVTRLAQMGRAVGIHLLLATQRPSVDVITGLIKANFPARVSFRVASKVDSRTILDSNGAESLLGKGDMLYLPAGSARLHRMHGPLVTEDEILSVCDFWKAQAKAKYNEHLLEPPKDETAVARETGEPGAEDVDDELYHDAIRVVCEMGRASTSTLQRRLRIGYGRAARLIDLMEKDGIVGPADGTKPREVLKKKDWMKEFDESIQ